MSGFTQKKLAGTLVEKHDRFISEYGDELETAQQLTMLREKKDQLLHWMEENGSKGKFFKELEDTENELGNLKAAFKPKNQSHYAGLREKIEEHKSARTYWLQKMSELKA
jgi:hypothetical protein